MNRSVKQEHRSTHPVLSLIGLLAIVGILPHTLSAQAVQRTLLLELDSVKAEEVETARQVFGPSADEALISDIRGTAFVLATQAEAALLQERGIHARIVMQDTNRLTLFRRALYGEHMRCSPVYHSYERIVGEIDDLAHEHPGVIRKIAIGQTSQEHRTMYAAVITSSIHPDREKPAILLNGCHHADELMGAEICTAAMRALVTRYGTDTAITGWVNNLRILVVPVVNVDGHAVVTSSRDPRWRKNTRDTNHNGTLYEYPEGVDLNRNYDFNWAHGGSGEPSSERYRGPYPFSESENRAMAQLADRERFLLSLTYHSSGEVVYYPWDWRGRKAPDDALLTGIARGLAGSIGTMTSDTSYRAEYGAGTVGQTYPWLYGRYGTFDFVVETGKGASFFPPDEVEGIVTNNLRGIWYLLRKASGPGISLHVTDAQSAKPIEAELWLPAIETEDVTRRTTNPSTGMLWRLLAPGTYQAIVQKDGYQPVILDSVSVHPSGWTVINVALRADAGMTRHWKGSN